MFKKLDKYFSYDREKYDNFLDDENNTLWLWMNKIISFLVVVFIFVLILERVDDLNIFLAKPFFILDAFISVVLAIEYVYRWIKSRSKLHFFANPHRLVDLLSFLPFFFWFVTLWNFWKVLRLLRVLRILRFIKKIPLTSGFVKSLRDYGDEYKAVLILFMVVLIFDSFLVYYVEKDLVWTKFTSIPMTLWWGLVTMTTVWFGDMYPISPLGKLFWSIVVFLWPLLIAVWSAVTIMVFMETAENQRVLMKSRRVKECIRCGIKNTKKANYCLSCWKKFIVNKEDKNI